MKKIILSIGLTLLLVSCNQENYLINSEGKEEVASFEEYLEFFNPDTESQILIQSSSSLNSTNNIYNITSSVKADKNPFSFKADDVLFEGLDIYRSTENSNWNISDQDLGSLFGKRFNLDLADNTIVAQTISESTNQASEVYLPNLLTADISALEDGKIVAGTTITWNADKENLKGMILTVEYKPLDQKEQTIAEDFPEPIMRGSTMADTGSYTVTASDLSSFPDGATLSFHIGRAGFAIINSTNGDNDYSVGAYTVVRGDFSIKK